MTQVATGRSSWFTRWGTYCASPGHMATIAMGLLVLYEPTLHGMNAQSSSLRAFIRPSVTASGNQALGHMATTAVVLLVLCELTRHGTNAQSSPLRAFIRPSVTARATKRSSNAL